MNDKLKKKSIVKSGIIVSVIVCIGKVLGFLKQAVIAWAFGANAGTDIYFAADSYIAMFGQIQTASISPSVLTEYIHLDEYHKKQELESLLRRCFFVFPLIAFVLISLNIGLSGFISSLLGISYSPEQRHELQKFIIYLCPVILFTAFSGVSNGILDANERFVPSRLLSLFFSSAIIIFILAFHNQLGVKSMLIGFLIGYGVHTIYVFWLSKKYFSFGKVIRNDPCFRNVVRSVVPLVIGNSIVDLGHLVDKIIASSLVTGSVSYLYYGQVISNDLVNAVIITTVGSILLPSLTKMAANKCDGTIIADRISEILSIIVALIFGILGLYIVEGSDLIKLFFERGSFTSETTSHVSSIAICYATGFAFIAVREILTKTHYAFQDTSTPMKNGIVGVGVNTGLSMVLSRFLGVSGVALATSISMAVVAIMMCVSIKKHIGTSPLNRMFFASLLKTVIGTLVMIIVGVILFNFTNNFYYLVRLISVSISMLGIYVLSLWLLKHEVVNYAKTIVHKR